MGASKAAARRKRALQIGIFLLFCIALYFPVFYRLDALPLFTWDESLFALRAFHYLEFGSYMENFSNYPGLIDHRNTKLPFTTFFQVAGLKLFGINELGVRLPVAFIFIGTLFYCCYFFKKHFQSISIGYLLGLLLVASTGFVHLHMLRTGDQDAPFACYLLLAILFFHRYIQTNKTRPLLAFSVAVIAALLTKNLLAGLLFPGLLLYAIHQKKLLQLLKDPRIYLALVLILGSYAATVGYFEWRFPGFIDRMWNYELMGRYSETIEQHGGSALYYVEYLFWRGFMPFSVIMFFSLFLTRDKQMNPAVKDLILLAAYSLLGYLAVISLSETKTLWYSAPLFPITALITALGLHHLFSQYVAQLNTIPKAGVYIITGCVFIMPYMQVVEDIMQRPLHAEHYYDKLIKEVQHSFPNERNYVLIDPVYSFSTYFQKLKYNALPNAGYELEFQRSPSKQLKLGDHVATCNGGVMERIKKHYEHEIRFKKEGCRFIKITGKRNGESANITPGKQPH